MSFVFFNIGYIISTFLVSIPPIRRVLECVFGGKDNTKNNTKCRHFGFLVKKYEQHYDK